MSSPTTVFPNASEGVMSEDFPLHQPLSRQGAIQSESSSHSRDIEHNSNRLSMGSQRDLESSMDDFHPQRPSRQFTASSGSTVRSQDLETTIHGSCPRCHHFHDANVLQLHISRRGTFKNKIICTRCKTPWFALGGHDTAYSLLSQETDADFETSPPSISSSRRGRGAGCYDHAPSTPSRLRHSLHNPEEFSQPLSEVHEEGSRSASPDGANDPPRQQNPIEDASSQNHEGDHDAEFERSANYSPPPENKRKSWLRKARNSRVGKFLKDVKTLLLHRRQRHQRNNAPAIGYGDGALRPHSTRSEDPHATTPIQSVMTTTAPASISRIDLAVMPGSRRVSPPEEGDSGTRETHSSVSPLSSSHPLDSPDGEPFEPLPAPFYNEIRDPETRNKILQIRAQKTIQARSQHGSGCHCTVDCPNCTPACNAITGSDLVDLGDRSRTPVSQLSSRRTPSPSQPANFDVGQWLEAQTPHPEHVDPRSHRESMVTWSSHAETAETNVSMEFEGIPPPAPTPPISARCTPPRRPSINTNLPPRWSPAPNRDSALVDENEPVEEINDDSGIGMDSPPGPQHARTWPAHGMA